MNDQEIVGVKELAKVMKMSESMIYKYKREGYRMEFGFRTRVCHFQDWLRNHVQEQLVGASTDLKRELGRLQ